MRNSWAVMAVAGCLLGGYANAAIVTVTYNGTLNGSTYLSNGPGQTYTNAPFTATFEMDTNQGGRVDRSWGSEVSGEGDGSVISETFSVGSLSWAFGPSAYGELIHTAGKDAEAGGVNAAILSDGGYEYFQMRMDLFSPSVPVLVDDAFSASGTGSGLVYDEFAHRTPRYYGVDIFILSPTSVTVTSIPSPPRTGGSGGEFGSRVPEPSTWCLMIIGIGGAGIALRRRRRAAAI